MCSRGFLDGGLLALCSLTIATACNDGSDAQRVTDPADVGTAVAEISAIPTGVACVRIVLSGSTSATRSFTVTAGTTPVKLNLGVLASGSVTLTPTAFNLACSSVTSSSVPSWTGSAVAAVITPGVTTDIAMALRANLPVTTTVDFQNFAVAVAVGNISAYALLNDGTVRAWGGNYSGELGDGTTTSSMTPVTVAGVNGVVSIAAGNSHACARNSNGVVKCWGNNTYGQLGNGTTTNSPTPVTVSGSHTFSSLAMGAYHSCGTTNAGNYCWGYNSSGQLGDGTRTNRTIPVASQLPGELLVSFSEATFTLSFSGNYGNAVGYNASGVFGDGTSAVSVTYPVENGLTMGRTRFVATAAAGNSHACVAEASAGNVYCSGANFEGQLGDGTTTSRTSPVLVNGVTNVVALSAGWAHTCAIKGDGSVWCWGANNAGQLGDGTGIARGTPGKVLGLDSGAVSIASGDASTCVVKSDGAIWCWGLNGTGVLGDGTTTSRAVPVKVRL